MCKQSLKANLVAFVLQLVFWILLAYIFRLPVCECLSALSQLNVSLLMSTVGGCFFTWNFTCNLTSWLELLFSQIRNSITVWCFPFCFFFRRDCVHKSFNFYYTSKASENFRNVQELWKQHFVSCNRLCQGFQRHLDMYANVWEITVFVWEANVK